MKDTTDEAQAHYDALMAQKTSQQKLAMAADMFSFARKMTRAQIRAEGITDPDEENRQVVLRWYGIDLNDLTPPRSTGLKGPATPRET